MNSPIACCSGNMRLARSPSKPSIAYLRSLWPSYGPKQALEHSTITSLHTSRCDCSDQANNTCERTLLLKGCSARAKSGPLPVTFPVNINTTPAFVVAISIDFPIISFSALFRLLLLLPFILLFRLCRAPSAVATLTLQPIIQPCSLIRVSNQTNRR